MLLKQKKLSTNQYKLLLFILAPLALLVIILMVVDLMTSKSTEDLINNKQTENIIQNIQDFIDTQEKTGPVVRDEVPTNIFVPEPTMILTEEQKQVIALPSVAAPAAPGVTAKLRIFQLKGENNKFEPYLITVRDGDIVKIIIQAIDRDYDLTIPDLGMQIIARQGETKEMEFQANGVGSLVFYCQRCGGSTSNSQGTIFIDQSQ